MKCSGGRISGTGCQERRQQSRLGTRHFLGRESVAIARSWSCLCIRLPKGLHLTVLKCQALLVRPEAISYMIGPMGSAFSK